jgi:hypothetical protein
VLRNGQWGTALVWFEKWAQRCLPNAHIFELMAVFIVISTVLFAWTLGLVVLDPARWPPAVAWE